MRKKGSKRKREWKKGFVSNDSMYEFILLCVKWWTLHTTKSLILREWNVPVEIVKKREIFNWIDIVVVVVIFSSTAESTLTKYNETKEDWAEFIQE